MPHVFGPVPSRRLGRSLGVDLIPYKVCSFDCQYCQVGRTTEKTVSRKEWVPLDEVVREIHDKLSSRPDYITIAGSGEPTLYSRLGDLVARIKQLTHTPVAVLTNGSLLHDAKVRHDLAEVDLVVPSLDAGDPETWQAINRPDRHIDFEHYVEGMIGFGETYKGKLWLEVFLCRGVNDSKDQVKRIAELAGEIAPQRIQLNTVTRPPAESSAHPVPMDRLQQLARLFVPEAEIIAGAPASQSDQTLQVSPDEILEMLARRPCTIEDIAAGLGAQEAQVMGVVKELFRAGKVREQDVTGMVYYELTTKH